MPTTVAQELGAQLLRRLRADPSATVAHFVDRRGHDQVISSAGLLRRAAGLATAISVDFDTRHRPITITEPQGPEALVAVVSCLCAGFAFHVRPRSFLDATHDGLVLTGPHATVPRGQFRCEIALGTVADADPSVLDDFSPRVREPYAGDAFPNVRETIVRMQINAASVVASFAGIDHRIGLAASTLAPLLAGSRLVRSDESFFLRNPSRWLRLLDEHDVTHAVLPHSAVTRLSLEPGKRPELRHMKFIVTDRIDSDNVDLLLAGAIGTSTDRSIRVISLSHC